MKKNFKIVLFSLLTIFCLTLVCSATEYSFTLVNDSPPFANEYDIMSNYDSIIFNYENENINLQFIQVADLGYSNVFLYCSNIEKYVKFVDDNVPFGADEVQFSGYILDEIISLNFEADDLSSDWFTEELLSMLFYNGLDFISISDTSFSEGLRIGRIEGYNEGYIQGTYNGMQETETLKTALLTIFSSPLYVLGGILDFEVFGLNLFNLISTLLTIMLFAFVVKHLLL